MDGVHDLGGMHGFGPVEREENEPVFHAAWEKTVRGLMQVATTRRLFNTDEFRHAIERMHPVEYLAASYYERWLTALERLLDEKGVVSRSELEARTALLLERPDLPVPQREDPGLIEQLRGRSQARRPSRPDGPAPRFAVGDRILTRNMHPAGHTRLPRYARGKLGVIHRVHGAFALADGNAHGRGEQLQPLYTVGFECRELWGDAAEVPGRVFLDLWESYLEPGSVSVA